MNTSQRIAPVVFFLLIATMMTTNGQPLRVDFRQAANDKSPYALGEVNWRQSILQQNNSVYYEGMSVPQRILFTNISATQGNQHSLTFSHKATKGGRHAYDFLTSYDQALSAANAIVGPTILYDLNPCGADIGPPKSMEQSCVSVRNGNYTIAVPAPDNMGSLLSHSIAGSVAAYEARFGNRVVKLYGSKAINSAALVFNGYTGGSDATAEYTLTWTSASSTLLIEMAGHLSMGVDVNGAGSGIGYGSGYGAGSINGGPYHFKLKKLDGAALGSQDNQIKSADIKTSITCNTTGLGLVCAGSENTYSFPTTQTGLSYTWSLSDNTSGAFIVGSPTGQSVVVNAGTGSGEYTITVIVRDGLQTVMCPYYVTVTGFNVTATPLPILCAGNKTPVTVAASGGVAPYTGTGTFLRHAGTHTFTVTDANGCQGSATVTILEPSQLLAQASATTVLCGTSTAEITVSASGGKPPYAGIGKFNRGVGTHTFSVTDANNCVALASVTVSAPPVLTANVSATSIQCTGGDATVTVSATGGTPPYSGVGTFTRPAGTYTFTVADANSCTATETVTITEPPQLTATASPVQQIQCHSGTTTVVVAASGGTPPYNGAGSFTRGAGTHTFTVTDANGCTAISTVTLTEPATALTVTSSAGSSVLCYGGTTAVTVNATGGTPPYTGTGTQQLGAGTHTLTVTDANGCTASSTVTLTQPAAALSVTASTSSTVLCFGGSTMVDVTATGGTPPYVGTGTFSKSAGTHTFTVTDANGCTESTTLSITQPAQALTATAAVTSQIDCYGGTGTIDVTATGGTPPYSGTGTFSKTAGTYTFTVTDANNCTTTASATLTQPASAVTVSAVVTSQVACYGGTGTVDVTATGGTPPYTGTGTHQLGTGTHILTVTDANGCATSTSVTVTGPTQQLSISVNAAQVLCNTSSALVTVSATGGTPPYTGTGTFTRGAGTYVFTVTDANNCAVMSSPITITAPPALVASLSAPSIQCNGGTTTVSVSVAGGTPPYTGVGSYTVGAGIHTYIVTDANNCADTVSITLTEPTLLTATAVSSNVLCFGGTAAVTVSASGGVPPYTGTGIQNLGVGTHTLTVTDANSCTATTTVTIGGPTQQLNIAVSAAPIQCNGGSSVVTVTATGGTPPYTGTGTFVRSPGTYTFTITDGNNCSVTSAPVTITAPQQLVASISAPPILCNGRTTTISVTASGGTPPYSGTGSYTVGAGTYTYVVSDANSCSDTVSLTLTEPTQLTASSVATTIQCYGTTSTVTVTASGGTPPYSGTGTFTRGAGTYTLTVTDANGCTATTAISITQPPQYITTATATPILCNGGSSTVTVTAVGGTPPYTGIGTYTRGPGTYTFTVTDANSCTESATVTITEPPVLVASAVAPPILCNGGSTTISVSATGGTPPYTGNGNFTVGRGVYSYVVTDANGCSDSVSITVNEPTLLTVNAVATPILCFGDLSTITVTASGGTAPYTGTGTFTRGAGTYWFTVTDANGCTETATITLTQPTRLVLTANAPTLSCGRDSATVTVTATGGTQPYSGAGSFERTLGTHTFIVSDANGCKDSVSVTITGPPPLYAAANATPILCYGGTTTITVTGWGGTPPYSGVGNFIKGAGTYTFVVMDANNCTDTVEVTITEPPQLAAVADAPPIACNDDSTTVTVTASGGTPPYTGVGSFNRGPGTHTFVVMDANGCTDTVSITLNNPPVLQATVSATPILCNGDQSVVTVMATGGTPPYTGVGTYLRGAGTHHFVVTDARNCQALVSITIVEPPVLAAVASAPPVACSGDSVQISVTATGGTPPYSGTGKFWRTAGTYAFVVTDANGCTDTVQATVTAPPTLFASASATPILCHGGTTTITVTAWGGTPPYAGIGTFTRGAGTHTFIISDANGCLDTAQVVVVEPPPLEVICDLSPCVNGVRTITALVTGGTPGYSYLWMPFQATTPSIDVPCSFSGTVTLRVRDANWTSSDPNNSACEAYCSVTIYSKEQENGTPASVAEENGYELYENYPNPFNPTTTIRYYVPELSHVRLSIINTLGQVITTLVDTEVPGGVHHVTWDANAGYGINVSSGSYIYRMHAKSLISDVEYIKDRLMLLLR